MLPTIAISDLQKSLSKTVNNLRGAVYIFSNNKPAGALIDVNLMQYLEENGVLEEYEDHLLYSMAEKDLDKAHEKLEKNDDSDLLTFDELCRSL